MLHLQVEPEGLLKPLYLTRGVVFTVAMHAECARLLDSIAFAHYVDGIVAHIVPVALFRQLIDWIAVVEHSLMPTFAVGGRLSVDRITL